MEYKCPRLRDSEKKCSAETISLFKIKSRSNELQVDTYFVKEEYYVKTIMYNLENNL